MQQAQPLRQKMDQARARFIGDASTAEGPGEFRASAAGDDAGPDRPGKAHVGLVKTLEALTGIIEKRWNPYAEPTTGQLDSHSPGIEANPPYLFGNSVSGRRRGLGCRAGCWTGPRALGPGRGRSQGDGRLRRGARSRRTAGSAHRSHRRRRKRAPRRQRPWSRVLPRKNRFNTSGTPPRDAAMIVRKTIHRVFVGVLRIKFWHMVLCYVWVPSKTLKGFHVVYIRQSFSSARSWQSTILWKLEQFNDQLGTLVF